MLNTPSVMSSLRRSDGQRRAESARGVDVLVREHLDRGAAQPAAVDDARVIELVGDDDVVLRKDRRDRAGIGRKAALEDDHRFGLLERCEPSSSSTCRLIVPAIVRTEPDADAEASDGLERALAQPRMRRQAQVVVRGEVDDLAVVERGRGALFPFEHSKVPEQPLLPELLDFSRQECEGIGAHAHRTL